MFVVNEKSWAEHEASGIAAINDPKQKNHTAKNAEAMTQAAITEVAGIRRGDIVFFYVMATKKILGVYETTTTAFYDTNPLSSTARIINNNFPFRVGFRKIIDFPNPISIDDLWASKDEGKIWTIQQNRGDAVGVHACTNFSRKEGEAIVRMFKENNVNYKQVKMPNNIINGHRPLPISIDNNNGVFKFERSLQSFLLEDFADNKHQDLFGEYDNFLVNVPTSARKEIDILLLRHDELGVVSYQILELQKERLDMEHINRLILYEQWIRRTREKGNPRNVYSVAIASDFKPEVVEYVKKRPQYNEKIIRLIRYSYAAPNTIKLDEVTPW